MPSIDTDDDVFGSRYLSPNSGSSPRKSPSRQSLSLNGRKSSASLRGPSSLADSLGDDAANGRHSLAHELAAALLPEPSAGSKLLAEEFGIEYDEGAEGIDGTPQGTYDESAPQFQEGDMEMGGSDSLAAQLNGASAHSHPHSPVHPTEDAPPDFDPDFRSPTVSPAKPRRQPEQDPMVILAADLEYTEKFLSQLRRLDSVEPSHTTPTLERLASDMIRRINDAARDRETQLRELLEYEREFRKIAGEVGGTDALGVLPELEDMIKDDVHAAGPSSARPGADVAELEAIAEDTTLNSNDWEVDPDRARLGDEEEEEFEDAYLPTPVKTEFPPLPALTGPPTPAATIPLLTHIRTFTASTATSLATISEHTQVNAAATTEAGRKIRALKNKLGGWRTEWDSAERSRLRIERWEAGIVEGDSTPPSGAMSPPRAQRRVDGRKIVQEHLQAFEQALMEAHTKTQAIIAAVS
ncbi:hypothetical protein C8Q76DRAFT_715912 [Earliella scabrosa]|nr:hypothetical protein C8Q76DRAFT_715912 [Earliella scabrosa]